MSAVPTTTADVLACLADAYTLTLTGTVDRVQLNRELPNGRGNAWARLTDEHGSLDICLSYLVVAIARKGLLPDSTRVRVEGHVAPGRPNPGDMIWFVVEALEVLS